MKTTSVTADRLPIIDLKLERMQFHAMRVLPEVTSLAMVDTLDVQVRRVMGSLAVQMKAEVYTEKLASATYKYPRDWWEAVKERFAPKWFLRKHPVQYRVLVLDARAYIPKLNIAFPDKRPVFRVFIPPSL